MCFKNIDEAEKLLNVLEPLLKKIFKIYIYIFFKICKNKINFTEETTREQNRKDKVEITKATIFFFKTNNTQTNRK